MTEPNCERDEEYCNDCYFKEYRAAIVITDQIEPDYRECVDSVFLELAEEQGHAFTLDSFTKFIESGKLLQLKNSLPVGYYLFVRFIPMFQEYPTPAQLDGEEPMPEIFCSTTKKLGKDGEL